MNNDTDTAALIVQLDAILPQTQCGQCGYDGCRPYAEALAAGAADVNQCPPGGVAGMRALARILQVADQPLNTSHGVWKPRAVALIDESECIGCTLCIQACPVDAILGASKYMHTVIGMECTGCELCVAPCPVDCISMQPADAAAGSESAAAEPAARARSQAAAGVARVRYEQRRLRLRREKQERAQRRASRLANIGSDGLDSSLARQALAAAARAQALIKRQPHVSASGNRVEPGTDEEQTQA